MKTWFTSFTSVDRNLTVETENASLRCRSYGTLYKPVYQPRIVYLTSHVDDPLFLSPNIEHIRYVYDRLSKCYSMTFDEEAREYLGCSITRDRPNRF